MSGATSWLFLTLTIPLSVSASTPAEAKGREDAIKNVRATIERECRELGAGDWLKWFQGTAEFRANLRSKLNELAARVPLFQKDPTTPSPVLKTDTIPPLFETGDGAFYLIGASEPRDPEVWVRELPVVPAMKKISDWLRRLQIDLIVVPVPKMTEVYADRMALGAIPGRISSPHMRRLIYDLSDMNVEVVDLLPAFLRERDRDAEPLYLPSDSHWSDRAQRIAAAEISRRLHRYDFVKAAGKRPSSFSTTPVERQFDGSIIGKLSATEQAEAKVFMDHLKLTEVNHDGQPFVEPADSPVVVIGDSYTHYFQLVIRKGTGIDALLSREINIPVSNVSSAGGTTQPIKEFLRDPDRLRNRKVVIWIVTNSIVNYGGTLWDLPTLPDDILKQ